MRAVWNNLAQPNLSLLRPWTDELERTKPFIAPYLSIHDFGNKQLFFVAARHGPDEESPTHKTVHHVIKNFKPDLVVVEGLINEGILSPKSFISDHELARPSSFVTSSEQAYAAYLARKAGANFISGEPTSNEILAGYRAAGISDRDFLFLDVTGILHSMLRARRLDNDQQALQTTSHRMLGLRAVRFGIETQTADQLAAWFTEKSGAPFCSESLRALDNTPKHDAAASFFQKASWAGDMNREPTIVRNIWAALQEANRVMVVYGSSHQPKQQPVYDALSGTKARHYKFF